MLRLHQSGSRWAIKLLKLVVELLCHWLVIRDWLVPGAEMVVLKLFSHTRVRGLQSSVVDGSASCVCLEQFRQILDLNLGRWLLEFAQRTSSFGWAFFLRFISAVVWWLHGFYVTFILSEQLVLRFLSVLFHPLIVRLIDGRHQKWST